MDVSISCKQRLASHRTNKPSYPQEHSLALDIHLTYKAECSHVEFYESFIIFQNLRIDAPRKNNSWNKINTPCLWKANI